jgi:hypothetical protein
MNRLALTAPIVLALSAASFLATGCTIYTYDSPPPKTRPGKAKPAATTATTATGKNPIVRRPVGGSKTPGTDTPTDQPPALKGSTIFGSGTVASFKGETYVIPEGTKTMPNYDELVPFALLYTDQFNVSPQAFSGGFPGALLQDEWFGIRYTGRIAIPASGKVTFKMVSDDGAILYIDGKKVLDNDGVHTAKTITGDATLDTGRHDLRIDYFQEKKGNVALQLFIVAAGQDVPVVGIR